jgi:uncharacterized protein
MVKQLLRFLWLLPRSAMILLVRAYQTTLSPDHGPLRHSHPYGFCRHEPTCSMYAIQVLRERGLLIGSMLAIARVLTCNPWVKPSEMRMRRL